MCLSSSSSSLPSSSDLIVDFPHSHCSRSISVRFSNNIEVRFIPNDAIKYKQDLWLSSEEISACRSHGKIMMLSLRSRNMSLLHYAERNIQDTSSFLGLESYLTRSSVREIMVRRRSYFEAVLSEQYRQVSEGLQDVDALSVVSETNSDWARKRSVIIGSLHA
eukprot:g8467.t1 g8467   contig3:170902-171390(-)